MIECFFCDIVSGNKQDAGVIRDLEMDKFVARWDDNPVTPGHAIIFPKQHAQFMKDLDQDEASTLIGVVDSVKEYIMKADLVDVHENLLKRVSTTKSEPFARKALEQIRGDSGPPGAFNDGINDGPAAGQTVPHFHWHVMPRWNGDVVDPRGGIRHMFAGKGNYREGVKPAD